MAAEVRLGECLKGPESSVKARQEIGRTRNYHLR
jgi:hypothetical protein